MDQIAALHWLQQNVALFGGDPKNVTLMGHGTGAACIHFLMMSPTVTPGLFHRAALMSGSAYSPWALVQDPVRAAVRVASKLNCSVPADLARDHEDIVDCLRNAPLDSLLDAAADLPAPDYISVFGPSVDGVVIKRDLVKEFLSASKKALGGSDGKEASEFIRY
ncbi:neuroligin-3-like [Frankliniella occidentalis]|uniref:Neuroligin-3-like n=1 Tax=Frankliniella occidentalis TaxID=133901 RepID=A0A9C6WS52_FRAOC|nr:neuroligin-3-like [Frankliniella occidentalis]